jgi:diguanylate cyclase (GGDEF)-like protein
MSAPRAAGASTDGLDDLVFIEEAPVTPAGQARRPWRVMVVDDDADVHSSTSFALGSLEVQGRPLHFLHAYSADEARTLLAHEPDLALVLLDVVMEQADAGLHLVRHIRETLGRADVRIILRTGQPGYAPEMDAIRGYDINDYRTKSELTRAKLYTAVAAAIRSYQQIRALDRGRAGLEQIIRASTELMALHGLPDFAHGVLEQVSGLLGEAPRGVLCAHAPAQPDGLELVAAAGMTAPAQAPLLETVARALGEKRHQFAPDMLALYLPGKSGRDFAVGLELGKPVGPLRRRLLEVFSGNLAAGLDNVELVTHLNQAAFNDSLTGLPNRTTLVQLADTALAGPERARSVLALVDLDHFAATTDALGHHFGDMLLVAVARRLVAQLSPALAVARIDSDIFALLGPAEAVDPATVQAIFATPFSIDGQDAQLSATLGLVRLAEHDGNGADALKDADIALKRAKSRRHAGHLYFSRCMGVEIRERVRMMHALRQGYARGELFLAYQPQVELASGRPFGAEALLRWRTEDGRLVSPERFIPIAEYSGLIIELGEWVLREACAELVRLHAAGYREFAMSVNVSQVQFRHPQFLQMLGRALTDTGVLAPCVELEITESVAMEEPEQLTAMLEQVKRMGVSIAIDDFGTGFSSLSHLQRLKVDRLKIDRAFITEITGSARGSSIAEMVIQLGKNLSLAIIAEGVEDERQAAILRQLGCPQAQGFLYSRPLSARALRDWLDAQQQAGRIERVA